MSTNNNNMLDEDTIEQYLNHTKEFQNWIESLISKKPHRVTESSLETADTKIGR